MIKDLPSEEEIISKWEVGNLDNPLVSISCITYNHEKYICDAIEGFLIQNTKFSFEVLIHDDASTDQTAEVIRKYEKAYPKIIKPIYQKENQWSKDKEVIRNAQYGRMKGKYIAYCEGDDYWTEPHKLQKQVDFLEANPKFVLVGHPSATLFDDLNKGPEVYREITKHTLSKWNIINAYTLQISTIVIRYDILQKAGKKSSLSDHPFYILLAHFGKIGVLPDMMAVYRIHNHGASGRSKPEKAYDAQIRWISNLKQILGRKFYFGYHYLTAKIHTDYALNHPDVFKKDNYLKFYYFIKYSLFVAIIYPRNIRTVLRLIPKLFKF